MIDMENEINYEKLKKLVYPALNSKIKEMYSFGYYYIKQDDIWDFLLERIWYKKDDISLSDIVNDILNYSNEKIYDYYIEKKVNN